MNVTITTDASYSAKHNRGTYAFYISSNAGRMSKSGELRKKCSSPSEAEMKCIFNALVFLSQQEDIFSKCKDVHINTDSMNAIHIWKHDKVAIRKYRLKNLSKMMHGPRMQIKKLFSGKKIFLVHVKGHDDTNMASRSRANAMCDAAAKVEMGILINKLEGNEKG